MLAAMLTGPNTWVIDEAPDPLPEPGELLVRTEVAAICGSDLHSAAEAEAAQPPGFPGHEAVGTVLESRSRQFAPGDRVLCAPPAQTARCFAELQTIKETSVVRLPADSPGDVFVLAQQLGTAIFAMKRFWPAKSGQGHTAAVLGTGPAGLAFVSLLRRAGFTTIVASDLSPIRLASAAARGAHVVVDAGREDIQEIVMRLTDGTGADLVIEAAGKDATRHQAMRMVRVDGRIGLFGLAEHPGMSSYPLDEVFRRRPTIDMTWGAQFEAGLASFAEAVDHVRDGSADIHGMISHRFALHDLPAAFDLANAPGSATLKVAITFDEQ